MESSKTILEINLSLIRKNYSILKKLSGKAETSAVAKADSYGLGAREVTKALKEAGCRTFFTANIEEAVKLRESLGEGVNIYVLYGPFKEDLEEFVRYSLTPVLNHAGQIELWSGFASKKGERLPAMLHIDTGMHRLGMEESELKKWIEAGKKGLESIDLKYVTSHLVSSEEPENPINQIQLKKFKEYRSYFTGIPGSLANSGGIFLGGEYLADLTRPGVALYGGWIPKNSGLENPVSLFSPVIELQKVPKGDSVGYNGTFKAGSDSLVATLPLGYADGFFRYFGNRGQVFFDSYTAPVVGRVSMDLVTVDVTDIPRESVFLGKKAEIMGKNIPPEKLGANIGTIGYEILTSLGNRYSRVYI